MFVLRTPAMRASVLYYSSAPSRLLHLLLLLGAHTALVSTATTKRHEVDIDQSLLPADFFTDVSSPSLLRCAMLASPTGNDLLYNEEENKCRLVNFEPATFIRGPSAEGWTGWTTQVDAKPCPGPYEMMDGLGCFYLDTNNVIFADAMTVCSMGGKPISPPTDEAFVLLRTYLRSLGSQGRIAYWVGAPLNTASGLFEWSDGHTLDASSPLYRAGEPNGDEECTVTLYDVAYSSNFDLVDDPCTKLWRTVCHIG